ncbi:MAG TPA: hypothetical protein VKX25_12035 [Bryobacteraceae bacterium]|nr:hypothetical protein [Bryobacteraceae bacterium]
MFPALRASLFIALGQAAFVLPVYPQTACAVNHPSPGVFICYPREGAPGATETVPDIFHFSAQANAFPGRMIHAYAVLLDGHRIYQNKLAVASRELSIETNIESPVHSGSHALSLLLDTGHTAQISGITFRPAAEFGFCDEFSRLDPRACVPRRNGTPLDWSLDPQQNFARNLTGFTRQLARVEADTADAVAFDHNGNLYTASHSTSDIEIRRYRPDGSVSYDRLVRFCSPGFLSVSGFALHSDGRLWLAGNTTACLQTTPGALASQPPAGSHLHPFLIALDTNKPEPASLLFSTFLPAPASSVSALRIDSVGSAYLAGTSSTGSFLDIINPSGSALLSSHFFPQTELSALALGPSGTVYLTGRTGNATFLAAVDPASGQLSYRARFSPAEISSGEAIAMSPHQQILLAGRLLTSDNGQQLFLLRLDPCRNGRIHFETLGTSAIDAPIAAIQPALDRFATTAAPTSDSTGRPRLFTVSEAPACPATR